MKRVFQTVAACVAVAAAPLSAQIAAETTSQPAAGIQAQVIQGAGTVPSAPAQPAASEGKIVLYRGSGVMGAAVGCPIRFKGQELVELGRGKFAEWAVPAGRYVLTNKTASVEVTVVAGEVSFVRCMIKPGFMTGRADLQIVDEESFTEHRADYEQKQITYASAK